MISVSALFIKPPDLSLPQRLRTSTVAAYCVDSFGSCIIASNASSSSPRRCAHGTSGSLSAPSDNSQADLVFTDAHALITIPMNRRAGDFSIFLTVFSGAIVL